MESKIRPRLRLTEAHLAAGWGRTRTAPLSATEAQSITAYSEAFDELERACAAMDAFAAEVATQDAETQALYATIVAARTAVAAGTVDPARYERALSNRMAEDSPIGHLLQHEAQLEAAAVAAGEHIQRINAGWSALFADEPAQPERPRPGEYPIPAGMLVEQCRSCAADIVWTRTARGRALPLSLATSRDVGSQRYATNHFADCPDGKGWSKKR